MLNTFRRFPMPFLAPDGDEGGSATPAGGEGVQSGESAGSTRTYTEEYVKALRAENAGHRSELRTERQSRTGLEAQLRKFIGLKDGEPVEDYGKALDALSAGHVRALADAQAGAKALLLRAEFRALAVELGIVDPEAALLLADHAKVKVSDDGKVDGAKEALEALLIAKPYLKGSVVASVGGPTNPGETQVSQRNPFSKDSYNLTEQGRLFKEDPALAQRLRAEAK
jgi:hypothetical protein